MPTKCRHSRLFLDYLRYGKNVQRSCSSIAIEQGLQAALNHSRPSAVLRRHRGLISAQHGQVFIGLSFICSSVDDCGGAVNDGTGGEYSKENPRCFAPAEYRDHCDKKDGGNDEDGGIHFEPPSNAISFSVTSLETSRFPKTAFAPYWSQASSTMV